MLGIWAVLRTRLTATDDSFDFNRTLGRLKDMIAALPLATPEDEAALRAQQVRLYRTQCGPAPCVLRIVHGARRCGWIAVLCEAIGEPINQPAQLIEKPIKGRVKTGTWQSTGGLRHCCLASCDG